MLSKLVVIVALAFSAVSANATNMLVRNKNRQMFLSSANTYTFRGPVDSASVSAAMKGIYELAKKRGAANYPLFLVLDTPGGSITDGEDLIEYLKNIRNLHTISLFAASMGSAIAEALPGKRFITENGTLMFHRAKVGLAGQIAEGELESRLAWIKDIVGRLEQRNADRMSMAMPTYKAKVKDELWLNARQSVSEKAADEVVDIRCSNELIEKNDIMDIDLGFIALKLKFSGCPLFRNPELAIQDPEQKKAYNKYTGYLKTRFSPGVVLKGL